MICPNCKKEINDADDLKDIRAEQSFEYVEVKAQCDCGQKFYTSLSVNDFSPDE